MELRDIFYIVGIVFMTILSILFLVLVVAIMVIKKKITQLTNSLDGRLGVVKKIIDNPMNAAQVVGSMLIGKAARKVSTLLKPSK